MRYLRALPILLLLFAAATSVVAGQAGTLRVMASDEESGAPLAGVRVRLQGLEVGGVTDQAGVLQLDRLAPGPRTVHVRRLGYSHGVAATLVVAGATAEVNIRMERAPVALEPVHVVSRPGVLAQQGFFRRREAGIGTFLTRVEIEEIRPRTLSDVLRRQPGLLMSPTLAGASASSRGMRLNCPIQYYLDGIQVARLDIDHVPPGDVEGMEIYRGAASIPPAYKQGTALCGVILIWTRME